ncbi:TPA: hypothetical protein N0F65_012703 [Lagenidium giganteum]|uniref:cDENN domain-containing protein n=1 Tax=Lagenidium giganteum TaxID=4803 RepID=A0AAV2YGH5_9STRA|nr:TPA: hypothetical protein N0F65_012703 [Lagenidium giganteum]
MPLDAGVAPHLAPQRMTMPASFQRADDLVTPTSSTGTGASGSRRHLVAGGMVGSKPRTDHVVVGLAAPAEEELEDWSCDYEDNEAEDRHLQSQPRHERMSTASGGGRESTSSSKSGGRDDGSGLMAGRQRLSASFSRVSDTLRPTWRWKRQYSMDSGLGVDQREQLKHSRGTRQRKSSGDVSALEAPSLVASDNSLSMQPRSSSVGAGTLGDQLAELRSRLKLSSGLSSDLNVDDDDALDLDMLTASEGKLELRSLESGVDLGSVHVDKNADGEGGDDGDEDEEDEDWDVEFGFAEATDDEQTEAGARSSGGVDANRRRKENFNIFLPGALDLEELLADNDDDFLTTVRSKRARKQQEEPLFQKRRNNDTITQLASTGLSLDSSLHDNNSVGALRSSLTSSTSTTNVEYTLVDKYRLLDVASSTAYAVRIERYPKPSTTFSSLEKDAFEFPAMTENRFEEWLVHIVRSKCDHVSTKLRREREKLPKGRNQKNHQFQLISMPIGTPLVDGFFKQISMNRFFGDEKENRELIHVYFEKLATFGKGDDFGEGMLSEQDKEYVAAVSIEILQEAGRLYGPIQASTSGNGLSHNSSSSTSSNSSSSSKAMFWIRHFQASLRTCSDAFPTHRNVIALVELRYVCHHLTGLTNGELSYTWQICDQFPPFCPMEPIAGDSAPIIANEILEYYGALFVNVNTAMHSPAPSPSSVDPAVEEVQSVFAGASFGLPKDPVCLLALILCDIQHLYESKSSLCESSIPTIAELFDFEDDDIFSGRVMDPIPELQGESFPIHESALEDAIDHEVSPSSSRRTSSGGLGGWGSTSRLLSILKPCCSVRQTALHFYYDLISYTANPLVKAKCAVVMSGMNVAMAAAGAGNLRAAESLGYEALRLLESHTERRILYSDQQQPLLSCFNNDGLLSDLGREVLEVFGNVLIKNQKYRYGILCLEAAGTLYQFLNHGRNYEKLDRLLCSVTLQEDDVKRALPLHDKVARSTQKNGNVNEFVFLTQAVTSLWLREGNFARAEENLLAAFKFLREQSSVLPAYFSAAAAAAVAASRNYSASETTTASTSYSWSGTMMTTSSTNSSSLSGSYLSSRSTGEMDTSLNHDITLHLLLRDVYRATGRCVEGMQVLEFILHYSVRLPRGKRTMLRIMLAEDASKLRIFDLSRYMFLSLEQEANMYCEQYRDGFQSTGGSGSRSMNGMGSEMRYCFDMVFSMRYIVGRGKLYLRMGELRNAYAWLSLAHVKCDRESLQKQAQLHFMDGRILFELARQRQNHLELLKVQGITGVWPHSDADDFLKTFSSSLHGIDGPEKERFQQRMKDFLECSQNFDICVDRGIQAFWNAYDQYRALDDGLHQLKALLEIIRFHLAPIERAFFALGGNTDDDALLSCLGRCTEHSIDDHARRNTNHDSADGDMGDEEDAAEKARKTLLEVQKLIRRALSLGEQLGEPMLFVRSLCYASQTWVWLEKLASYKTDKHIKECAAFWEEAVKLLKAVFLRRVAFQYYADMNDSQAAANVTRLQYGTPVGTFSLVPILNFRESFILKLEESTLQLILVACHLQQFDRLPEYVDEMLLTHLDELLSARMCLSSISHQLRSFRAQHQQRHPVHVHAPPTPRSVTPSVISSDHGRSSSFTNSGVVTATSNSGGAPSKKKGHKKNQSMSSISELLTATGSTTPSFHDISSSFVGTSSKGSFISANTPTPRTGLASLGDRAGFGHRGSVLGGGALSPVTKYEPHSETPTVRSRGRSRSAPQPLQPKSPTSDSSGDPYQSRHGASRGYDDRDEASTTGAIGLYDFDEVQSEKLWWIFNTFRRTRENYMNGKLEMTAFRYQNLRCLRVLLDCFDPQQVAVLYCPESAVRANNNGSPQRKPAANPFGIFGFDVAHVNLHALIQEGNLVLSINHDISRIPQRYAQLRFKVFAVKDGDTTTWREHIPRPDWYLSHYDVIEADSGAPGAGILRTLRLFGAKPLLKLVASLLLENSVVVIGSSFPQIKEVTLCLLRLLQPFAWQHTAVPFLPITSWRFVFDTLVQYTQISTKTKPRPRKSLTMLPHEWRWGASSSASQAAAVDQDGAMEEPPFIIGLTAETWQICLSKLRELGHDARSISSLINVVDLDDLDSFSVAKTARNATSLPRKWRKQVLDRFAKVVKQRRKTQQKVGRRSSRQHSVSGSLSNLHLPSPVPITARSHDEHRRGSTSQWGTAVDASGLTAASFLGPNVTTGTESDDRLFYDGECYSTFLNGLAEIYGKMLSMCAERKKNKSKRSGKLSKKHEIKSWFSSSHECDAFVEKFETTDLYQHYESDRLNHRKFDDAQHHAFVQTGMLSISRASSVGSAVGSATHHGARLSSSNAAAGHTTSFSSMSGGVISCSSARAATSFGSVSSSSSLTGSGTHPAGIAM